jgi:putative addiction module killer protein
MQSRPREILFLDAGGFAGWMDALEAQNEAAYDAIVARLERVEEGNLGDCKSVGGGVSELRFSRAGPGYRVYFGEHNDLVIILCAGTKKTQNANVTRAKKLWKDYNKNV